MRRAALCTVLGLAALALVAWRVVYVGVTEHYSPDWHSASSADAARRGTLVRRLAVRHDPMTFGGAPVRVTDAWAERVTRVEYPYFLWRREVIEPGQQVVVVMERDAAAPPARWCDEWLAHDDGARFGGYGGTERRPIWTTIVPGAAPDTLRLTMLRKPECGAATVVPGSAALVPTG